MHRWLIFHLVCVLGLLGNVSAAMLVGTPRAIPAGDSAEIRWTTGVTTGSRVQYGRTDNALTQKAESEPGTDHVVVLRGLQPGVKYFYSVGTARLPLATNAFTTAGVAIASSSRETNRLPSISSQSPALRPAPSARQTWGNMASLPDHFERHGRDFQAKDTEDYARQAWEFQQRARREKLPMKVDEDGVLRIYDPKTRAFAAYNRDGTTKTYFKPQSRDYFERQPGQIVSPAKRIDMTYSCPACCYPALTEAPRSKSGGASYEICPSCGFQSGVDDDDRQITPTQWRKKWIQGGMKWTSKSITAPSGWNPAVQLKATSPRRA